MESHNLWENCPQMEINSEDKNEYLVRLVQIGYS